jgi:hypothetical protein
MIECVGIWAVVSTYQVVFHINGCTGQMSSPGGMHRDGVHEYKTRLCFAQDLFLNIKCALGRDCGLLFKQAIRYY